jgi:hypothetical protein
MELIQSSREVAKILANIASSLKQQIIQICTGKRVDGSQYNLFLLMKKRIFPDLSIDLFADMYAQLIV